MKLFHKDDLRKFFFCIHEYEYKKKVLTCYSLIHCLMWPQWKAASVGPQHLYSSWNAGDFANGAGADESTNNDSTRGNDEGHNVSSKLISDSEEGCSQAAFRELDNDSIGSESGREYDNGGYSGDDERPQSR